MKKTVLVLLISFTAALTWAQSQNGPRRQGGPQGAPPQMDSATKAAFEECAEELGLPSPGEGGARPSREQHDQLRECLKSKGIEAPRGGGPRPPSSSSTAN
ncbi:hypothetical protein [Pseudobdellovibrio exovorus]|uniref:Phosphate starvation-inducible protein PsiF n=1 Tax=Pseudobdellovibrio exovorus JSS TaxID=1184267 RepID=M4VA71_9BACT|nr:hypothetical protein [Pseudobdellovibrio exovorus]AGH94921.1 hypothetical protein A11Q_701 [Pseudobdellovibrio exovorus JSS]